MLGGSDGNRSLLTWSRVSSLGLKRLLQLRMQLRSCRAALRREPQRTSPCIGADEELLVFAAPSVAQNPNQLRLAAYLKGQQRTSTAVCCLPLAMRVADDPFRKVKKMIKDSIVKLMEEANEEAEHKGWCDTESSTNEQTREEKTEAVETLHAEIDELEASIAKLTEETT